MKISNSSLLSLPLVLLFSFYCATSADIRHNFIQCLITSHSVNTIPISQVIYTPNNSSYSSVLDFSIRNYRFLSPETPKPLLIITPLHESHIQAAVICSGKHGLQMRVRSGGHDFEGLSYVSHLPFFLLDMINLRSVTVDVENRSAWVQSATTLGELYYRIAEKIKTLAFPAGFCPTVAVGGQISGGGYGFLLRKFGLSVDNVIDAHLIDANGRILDRESMGEDLFWAIRGGSGGSFGVVIAWKIKLVEVPPIVTVFTIGRTLQQNATMLVHRWEHIAHKIDNNLVIATIINRVNSNKEGNISVLQVSFRALFLGRVDELLSLMHKNFPELGLVKADCLEMSWIESTVYTAGGFPSGSSPDVLLNRTPLTRRTFKGKSDYVKEPISETGLEGLWRRLYEEEAEGVLLIMIPYGGKMSEIPESETPFPHRAGNIHHILYSVNFTEGEAPNRYVDWMRRLYSYMAPYVSKSPREAYCNYRDLDLGKNSDKGYTSYTQASKWGIKYFKNNFNRLVQVKTMVDPTNFFRHEQSIPVLSPRGN